MRIIGAADEFWRLRLARVDTTEGLDFEWHDDILHRKPRPRLAEEIEIFTIEAVKLDDYDTTVCIASFGEREEAETFLARAKEDLTGMTKAQFEDAYLSGDADDTATRAD